MPSPDTKSPDLESIIVENPIHTAPTVRRADVPAEVRDLIDAGRGATFFRPVPPEVMTRAGGQREAVPTLASVPEVPLGDADTVSSTPHPPEILEAVASSQRVVQADDSIATPRRTRNRPKTAETPPFHPVPTAGELRRARLKQVLTSSNDVRGAVVVLLAIGALFGGTKLIKSCNLSTTSVMAPATPDATKR